MSFIGKAQSILRDHVYKKHLQNEHVEKWRNLPEIPSTEEIRGDVDGTKTVDRSPEEWDDYQKPLKYEVNLPHNIVDGPWESKEAYLGAHYQILREDATASLRRSVDHFRMYSGMMDDDKTHVYTDVCMAGYNLTRIGPACRVTFSTDRSGKRIDWEHSKRLAQGTIVALSPCRDNFHLECHIAVVAARPFLDGLDQNPPTVDLLWGDFELVNLDPSEKYYMLEARDGYFEASRHMLVAIQKLMTEKFPLSNHIALLEKNDQAPDFLEVHPWLNLTTLENTQPNGDKYLDNVDVLQDFPTEMETDLDASQLKACQNMLTTKVAIVQGPPGTGKTFVSVSALKVMIKNLGPGDPPIIVSAQTNHALDQLLNHLLRFEENILRLGGRSDKENKKILKRTIFELRQANQDVPGGRAGLKGCMKDLQSAVESMASTLQEMTHEGLIQSDTLVNLRIITEEQQASLVEGGWSDKPIPKEDDIKIWLGDQWSRIDKTSPVNMGLPLEEADIEFEQLKELEEEMNPDADGHAKVDDKDALSGHYVPFKRDVTGKIGRPIRDGKWRKFLGKNKDLYDTVADERGQLYKYFEKQIDSIMLHEFRDDFRRYMRVVNEFAIAKQLCNIKLCQHLGIKVIGCTTTGLSKYRGFLSALQPRTLLIEEAAETQEGMVIGGLMESIEQLILVGDHQQLQASCNIASLLEAPYHLSISMFERLVNNNFEYVMLNRQRRMIPEVRELLCVGDKPFYRDLHDHEDVKDRIVNRPPIPGMGGRDVFFFSHNWAEARDADGSCYNADEADFIIGYFHYLTLNGIPADKITILTFYNGQRKTLIKLLRNNPSTKGNTYFKVFTVDSYQGEENDVILLSLVRSNNTLGIGFLDNRNRIVVALSRAKRGLYMFGNASTLTAAETKEDIFGRDPLWDPLVQHLKSRRRLGFDEGLPIVCTRHSRQQLINYPSQWTFVQGGCDLPCDMSEPMPCGHRCKYKCHPFQHEAVTCMEPCERILPCGHGCSKYCYDLCRCDACQIDDDRQYVCLPAPPTPPPKITSWISRDEGPTPKNCGSLGRGGGTSGRGRSDLNPNIPRARRTPSGPSNVSGNRIGSGPGPLGSTPSRGKAPAEPETESDIDESIAQFRKLNVRREPAKPSFDSVYPADDEDNVAGEMEGEKANVEPKKISRKKGLSKAVVQPGPDKKEVEEMLINFD